MKKSIYDSFAVSTEEYEELDRAFGDLCHYATWQLLKKNSRNNHTDDFDDINQTLRESLVQAGCYYKRQVYIERCLGAAKKYAGGYFMSRLVDELWSLWKDRTRHGANRQKFGPHQEKLLERVVKKAVPKGDRPDKKARLEIDERFPTYCKQILWNRQKNLGKRITREKSLRSGLASLSEFEHLAQSE